MPRLSWACVVGPDFQRLLVVGDGLVNLSAAGQSHTEVVVGLREVGLDCHRLLEMGDGFVDPSAAGQSHTEVVVGFREVRLDFQAF